MIHLFIYYYLKFLGFIEDMVMVSMVQAHLWDNLLNVIKCYEIDFVDIWNILSSLKYMNWFYWCFYRPSYEMKLFNYMNWVCVIDLTIKWIVLN